MTIFEEAVAAAKKKETSEFWKLISKGVEQNDIRCVVFNEMHFRYMVIDHITIRDKKDYIKDNYDSILCYFPYEKYENDVYNENSDIIKEYCATYDDEKLERKDFIDWYLIDHIGIPERVIKNHWTNIISEKNTELITILIKAIQNMSEEELLSIKNKY